MDKGFLHKWKHIIHNEFEYFEINHSMTLPERKRVRNWCQTKTVFIQTNGITTTKTAMR